MPYCFDCGTEVGADASYCPNCGTALEFDADSGAGEDNAVPIDERELAGEQDGASDQPSEEPSSEEPVPQPANPSAQSPGSTSERDDGIMAQIKRRPLLALLGAGAVGLGGYFLLLDDDDSPEGVVVSYFNALNAGDTDAVNDLLHPDAPTDEVTEEDMAFIEGIEFTVHSTEVIEEDGDEAVVEADVTFDPEDAPAEEDTLTISLRKHDGEWLIWE